MPPKRKSLRHLLFVVSLVFKGVDGLIEFVSGILLFFVQAEVLQKLLFGYSMNILTNDSDDFIAGHLLQIAQGITISKKVFASLYLLGHGAIKLFLVTMLFEKKEWAFPSAIGMLSLFVLYEGYRFVQKPSVFFAVILVLDLIVIAMIWFEWHDVRKGKLQHRPAATRPAVQRQ